jgi:hypothetical protein
MEFSQAVGVLAKNLSKSGTARLKVEGVDWQEQIRMSGRQEALLS